MRKISKRFYECLSSVATFVAVLSVADVYSFCLLIIHQPDVPERLKNRLRVSKDSERGNENFSL